MQHFQHELLRKYAIIFGTLFNNVTIRRGSSDSPDEQSFVVPIEFAPKEKMLALTTAKDTDAKTKAIQLPRMAFEMTGMQYAMDRKFARDRVIGDKSGRNNMLRGIPYDLNFNLYIMTKNLLDAHKIVEQVLFMFQPDYPVEAKLIKGFDYAEDISTVFNGISNEDEYEGSFETMRRTVWTLEFVMHAWLYGPLEDGNRIHKITIDTHSSMSINSGADVKIIMPGLTPDGNPTSDPAQSIPYDEINMDDNYGIIILDEVKNPS